MLGRAWRPEQMPIQILSTGLGLDDSQIVQLADDAMYWQSRIKSDEAHIDLRGNETQKLPSDAVLVLCHEITHFLLDLYQIIWFKRTEDNDELWVFTEEDAADLVERFKGTAPEKWTAMLSKISNTCSCVYSVPQSHSFEESMIELLANWFVGGAGSPKSAEHLIACGYLSEGQYRLLLDRVQIFVDRKRKQYEQIVSRTLDRETEIIHVARELGLNPEPTGFGLSQWKAICPNASHGLYISSHGDQFFCGYCSVSGGIDELRRFVKDCKREKEVGTRKRPLPKVSKKNRHGEEVIRVVYGIDLFDTDQLIVVKESDAIQHASNIDVLHTARTWAEVKLRLTPDHFARLCEQFEDDDVFFDSEGRERKEPPGEALFDRTFIESEYAVDNWYFDPVADMNRWIPDEIKENYGHPSSSDIFENELLLDPKFEHQIKSELAAHGFWAVRNDDLVMATFEWEEGRLEDILQGRKAAK